MPAPLPSRLLVFLLLVCVSSPCFAEEANVWQAGVSQVDITPAYPVRLSGFGFRRTESEGVTQRIWAKALALGDKEPAVLITVDNLGVSAGIVRELARRLEGQGVKSDRFAVTASHTHTAPMLTGVVPTLFGTAIPQAHQEHIDRYTREFADALEKAALAALADRKPARLTWGVGTVGFARNRRTAGGPVDHDLPVMVVRDLKGKVRAVYVSYACHCVTLSNNKVSGDWAGFAQQAIQDAYPGAVALTSVGCGADSNPDSGVTGDRSEIASRQGMQIAAEVRRMLQGNLAPVAGPITAATRELELPLAALPTREEWQERARRKDAVGYHARVQLDRLDHVKPLKTKIDYRVQTWTFGDTLAMVFLPGEVVVDYSLRLKRELHARRLWVNAYANDAPCYIPSERVLREGGYEGRDAMVYYDVPGPFAPGLEQKIVSAALDQLRPRFAPAAGPDRKGDAGPPSPQQACSALRVKAGMKAELVAAEPLVTSPVAIDFGPDGRLWVAEMYDYPMGLDGKYQPGGRVRVLEDTDGDGIYDKTTVFLDKIPFPTGVTVWRKGVLVCGAPDILYAEDTDGDGKADVIRKLYSGFGTDNYQARVNSLCYGLDGWVYGSCGLFGGRILSHKTGKVLQLGDRDFRIKPDTGEIEPATGQTQQGRVSNDWDDWFGCDNSELCRHYVLADHYLRRNPNAAAAQTAYHVADYPDWNRLFSARQRVQLFKSSGPPGRVTAACGMGVYRDDLLGADLQGNVLTCEPVNLVVHRLKLTPRGSTFSGRRAPDESTSEFLASTDNWFRPVQVRTGPDGALWVVDMCRFVVEHPRFIPPDVLKNVDVRGGANMGRIFRIRPEGKQLRQVPRLDLLDTAGLVAALDTPNGTLRDLAAQMLRWRKDSQAAPSLAGLCKNASRPEVRLIAMCLLDGLGCLTPDVVAAHLRDSHAGVRRHAIRLCEKLLHEKPELGLQMARAVNDADAQVRLQTAYSLGEWRDARAGVALADLGIRHPEDSFLVAAVLSSVNKDNIGEVLTRVFASPDPPMALAQRLVKIAVALADRKDLGDLIARTATWDDGQVVSWKLAALAALLEAIAARGQSPEQIMDAAAQGQVAMALVRARALAQDERVPEAERLAAIRLLVLVPGQAQDDALLLLQLVRPQNPASLQAAALASAARSPAPAVARKLLEGWAGYTPAVRSQVLDLLLGRDAWTKELIGALEKKDVPPDHIDAMRRQRLATHRDPAVRARVEKLFTANNPDRHKVLDTYAGALTAAGDVVRGKAVFGKVCSVCHKLEGVGYEVGPDLSAAAGKPASYLLQEILDPNRNVDGRYVEYVAVTKAGRSLTGLLAAETATGITLRAAEGKEHLLLRSEIDELSGTGKSLMPEGLEKDVSMSDMADLLAFLGSVARPPKKFAGNQPAVVRANKGQLALLATNAAIHGNEIAFEEPFHNVGLWHGADDYVVWTVDVEKETSFEVWLDWACDDGVAGNSYVLEGARPALGGKVAGSGGWDTYRQVKIGTVTLPAGIRRLTFRPDGPPRVALLDLRGIHLVPSGQKPNFR
jgi:putative membrane-bound dehydrogenase-like protein